MRKACLRNAAILVGAFVGMHVNAGAAVVTLQNATATYSQPTEPTPGWMASDAIDGNFSSMNGWAIAQGPGLQSASAQTLVFETAADLGSPAGTMLTFSLYQLHSLYEGHWNGGHNLGRFRLSVTSDARTEFADGLATNGDVTANWTVLEPISASATGGSFLNAQADGSLLASGANPDTSVYTISAFTSMVNITGIRLEALQDPSLPMNGPGRQSYNGNFVLTEFTVNASPVTVSTSPVPEPASFVMLAAGLGFLGLRGWKRMQVGSA